MDSTLLTPVMSASDPPNKALPREWGCQLVNYANESSFVTVSHKDDYEHDVCKNLSGVLLLNLSKVARC